jgi:hypothetical protein
VAVTANAQTDASRIPHQTADPVTYMRPGQPGYSVAKAFTALVRLDAEGNVDDLSYAFDLPKLREQGLVWKGPTHVFTWARFFADYNPPNSSVGISKLEIVWDAGRSVRLDGKPAISISLNISLRTDSCLSREEMEDATEVQMGKTPISSHGGRPFDIASTFTVKDGQGIATTIIASPDFCHISATYIREN